ncbi:MAG: type II toxin-antitoxin system RelE/ParE family toxin [Steroidobacteraceae bacterium]
MQDRTIWACAAWPVYSQMDIISSMPDGAPVTAKRLEWIGSSKKDLLALPEEVVDVFGYALYLAQVGQRHEQAKPLRGFGSAGILEVVEDRRGDAFRAVYTVRYAARVFVLHVFQKKSKSGIATPKADLDLIRSRLKLAERRAKELENEQTQNR